MIYYLLSKIIELLPDNRFTNACKKILLEFFKYILRSILFSVILFVVSLSFLTRQFPPDFSQIRNFYEMCQYGAHSSDTNEVVNDDEISELIKQRENVSKMLSNFKPNFKLETTDHLCLHEKSLIISLEDKISELKKPISN